MNHRVAAFGAVLLTTASVFAQTPTKQSPPPNKPVQETQAPENQVINPEQRVTGPLPPTAARAPATQPDTKPAKWDVNAPPGMTTRQIPIDTTEGSWMNTTDPVTSGEAAKPHMGTLHPATSFKSCFQTTVPEEGSSRIKAPVGPVTKSPPLARVGVARGPGPPSGSSKRASNC